MTSTNSTIAKIAALVAGFGLVALSFAVSPVHAQSASVQAQIAALQAQIAALQAQLGGGASVTFTRDLTIGSTGSDVVALQTFLISKGFSIPAGATGYFGLQTRAAVAAFQAANGISPTAGYFGPITRARINAMGTGSTGGSTGGTTGGLQGGAGTLRNVDIIGDVESDLHEGDSATKVLGFSADANGSDLAVTRVDVNLTINGSSGSSNIDRYIDSVSIYQDGKKLATLDASTGDKSGRVWSFRFSDLNGVIREGNTSNFYVEVTPVSSIGSSEAGVSLTAAIPTDGIRAVDAEGVSETYTPSGGASENFTVSTATNATIALNEASDNPKSTTVKADLNNTTDDITLLSFNLKPRNQNVTIHDLPVVVTTNGGGKISDYVQTVKLMKGSTVLKSKSATSTATSQTFLFDNIDQNLSKDDSQNYTVTVSVRKIDAGGSTFTSGDTLTASVPSSGAWDIEDSNGDSVSNPSTFTGNAITFQATGITVAKVDATATKTVGTTAGSGDNTQYSITFKVTAGDDDLYIGRTVANSATPSTTTLTWATTTSSNVGVTGAGAASLSVSDTNSSDTGLVYKIPAGTTRTFTLNVTLTATGTGFTGVQLTGFAYGLTSSLGTAYSSGLDTFKTQDISMTTH